MMSACQEKGSALQGSRTPEGHPFLNFDVQTMQFHPNPELGRSLSKRLLHEPAQLQSEQRKFTEHSKMSAHSKFYIR